MARRIVWAKVQSGADLNFGSRPVPIVKKQYQSEPHTRVHICFVDLQRSECCGAGFRKSIDGWEHASVAEHAVHVGQNGVRSRICGVRLNGLTGEFNTFAASLGSPLICLMPGPEEQKICLAILSRTLTEKCAFLVAQL